jgi:hypothetical protein
MSSSNALGSKTNIHASNSSKRSDKPNSHAFIIKDADGIDVTPLSLLTAVRGQSRHGKDTMISNSDLSSTARETVTDLINNIEALGSNNWTANANKRDSKSSFTVGISKSNASQSENQESYDETSSQASVDEDDATTISGIAKTKPIVMPTNAVELPGLSLVPKIIEYDPNALLHISLSESETMCLLNIPSTCVSLEAAEEAASVKAMNAKYREVFLLI